MTYPRAKNGDDDDIHTWKVSQNILKNQSWRVDKRSFSNTVLST